MILLKLHVEGFTLVTEEHDLFRPLCRAGIWDTGTLEVCYTLDFTENLTSSSFDERFELCVADIAINSSTFVIHLTDSTDGHYGSETLIYKESNIYVCKVSTTFFKAREPI